MIVNFASLSASLEIMWKGMAGLFIVCGFIAVMIMLISKIMMKKGK
jgi:Mg2+/Co2+ transporter CorB